MLRSVAYRIRKWTETAYLAHSGKRQFKAFGEPLFAEAFAQEATLGRKTTSHVEWAMSQVDFFTQSSALIGEFSDLTPEVIQRNFQEEEFEAI